MAKSNPKDWIKVEDRGDGTNIYRRSDGSQIIMSADEMKFSRDGERFLESFLKEKSVPRRLAIAKNLLSVMTAYVKSTGVAPNYLFAEKGQEFIRFLDNFFKDALKSKNPRITLDLIKKLELNNRDEVLILQSVLLLCSQTDESELGRQWFEKCKKRLKSAEKQLILRDPRFRDMIAPTKNSKGEKLIQFEAELKQAVDELRTESYDNPKDMITDATSFLSIARKFGPEQVKAAAQFHSEVIRYVKKAAKEEPSVKKYLKGLI